MADEKTEEPADLSSQNTEAEQAYAANTPEEEDSGLPDDALVEPAEDTGAVPDWEEELAAAKAAVPKIKRKAGEWVGWPPLKKRAVAEDLGQRSWVPSKVCSLFQITLTGMLL